MKNLRSFASGLLSDIDAVRNAVTSTLSNGFVEGQNNKTKAIKRTMYGRASIKLLRVKVLFWQIVVYRLLRMNPTGQVHFAWQHTSAATTHPSNSCVVLPVLL
jgi:hypothetical protein